MEKKENFDNSVEKIEIKNSFLVFFFFFPSIPTNPIIFEDTPLYVFEASLTWNKIFNEMGFIFSPLARCDWCWKI